MNGYKHSAAKRQSEQQASRPALCLAMIALQKSAEAMGMDDLARMYAKQGIIIARASYRDVSLKQ